MPVVDPRIAGKPVPRISKERMERECVARVKNVEALDVAFLDQRIPRHERDIVWSSYPHNFLSCCACATSGRAAASMSSDDELAPPHVGPPPPESVYRTLSLPQDGRRVLWTDLNAHRPMVSGSSIAN